LQTPDRPFPIQHCAKYRFVADRFHFFLFFVIKSTPDQISGGTSVSFFCDQSHLLSTKNARKARRIRSRFPRTPRLPAGRGRSALPAVFTGKIRARRGGDQLPAGIRKSAEDCS
jgi:hypothetical protein